MARWSNATLPEPNVQVSPAFWIAPAASTGAGTSIIRRSCSFVRTSGAPVVVTAVTVALTTSLRSRSPTVRVPLAVRPASASVSDALALFPAPTSTVGASFVPTSVKVTTVVLKSFVALESSVAVTV